MSDVIVALATPPLKSALAIIRISGDDCFNVVSKVFSKDLTNTKEKGIHHGYISYLEKKIDEVVLLTYVAPHSFTGENSVEIICHGSLLIANEIIAAILANGARYANNGEYSSRALLNRKIDLIQAEAINDMINATTSEAKTLSLFSLEGETSKLVRPIKTKIADLLSLIEVNIDYPEYYDIEVANKEKIIKECSVISNQISTLVKEGEQGKIIKDGVDVAIVGKPNVGKSSLLNTLIGKEKAIVTNIPGTTRDLVEGEFNYNGITYRLTDTAGIRESDDTVEQIGIVKAKECLDKADLVIALIEDEEELEEFKSLSKDKRIIFVQNKSDLIKERKEGRIYISALNKEVSPLLDEMNKIIGVSDDAFSKPSLNNARQIALLRIIKNSLDKSIEDAKNDLPVDLISSTLMVAYESCLDLLGESNTVDLEKEIFSRFCVGK